MDCVVQFWPNCTLPMSYGRRTEVATGMVWSGSVVWAAFTLETEENSIENHCDIF